VAAARLGTGTIGAMKTAIDNPGPALAQLGGGDGRLRWAWHILPWAIALGIFFVADTYISLGTAALEMILFTLSIDLALGYAGIITFGQAAFFGLGAYAAGLFSIHVAPDPLLGLLFGTIIAALFGLVTGMLILHTEGVTLMMLTLAIASMLSAVALQANGLTGGDNGLQGMHISPLFGLFPFDLWGRTGYLSACCCCGSSRRGGSFARPSAARSTASGKIRGACAPSARPSGGGWSRFTPSRRRWRARPAL
jgi:hypothetical protein